MDDSNTKKQTGLAKFGWGIVLAMSALLFLVGIFWYFGLPEMALENIAERTILQPDEFMVGKPSAFDIITLIARGYGAGYAVQGLMALILAVEGFRNGSRWAWMAMWVMVLAYATIAGIFLQAGETYALSLGVLSLVVITMAGLLLAGRRLSE